MANILIGSLQYSPIYKSHCCALGKQCIQKGHLVHYLFSHGYEWMLSPQEKELSFFVGNSTNIKKSILDGFSPQIGSQLEQIIKEYDYIYLYNFHPFLNYKLAKIAKSRGITLIQHIQEPYVENKKSYGFFQQSWLPVFERLQERIIMLSDKVIISSNIAKKSFTKRYNFFKGDLHFIPLMYEDMSDGKIYPKEKRKYITFTGPPVPAKGPEIFLNVADTANAMNLPHTFLVMSRKLITDERFTKSNIKIFQNEKINDEIMYNCIEKSLMSIVPYKVATQSSVTLTSFMRGTPVISSNIGGLLECIEHKQTGYIVDIDAPASEWLKGIDFINDHFDEMSIRCRKYFQDNHSDCNWPRYFGVLFND